MKIVITGSHGFIGQYLMKRFPKRNIITIPHVVLYDQAKLTSYIPKDTAYIYHLAGYGNMAYQKEVDLIVKANILTTHNLLMATKNIHYKAFVYFSTSSVYGVKSHPMHETNSLEATDYYGVTKICGEMLVRAFVHEFNKPVMIVRPFSVYGAGEADFRFIPTVLRCVKKDEPMKLAPGMHDWIEIEDFLDGLLLAQNYVKDLQGKAINIGTGQQYDNYDIVKYLSTFGKKNVNKLPITYIQSLRSFNTWVADNSLLRSLGWEQKYSLAEGLKKLYERT